MKLLILFLSLAMVCLLACSKTAPVTTKSLVNGYAITGVTIIDVEKGTARPGQTVIIKGDLIDQIGEHGKIKIPQGIEMIDGQGLYLMPGLVDAHVHYFNTQIFGRLMIANGVLLVRDTGMPNDYILKLRDELNQGITLGPEMIATGSMLDGYPPLIPSISFGIQTPEDGRAAVRQQTQAGVDMIKTYNRLDRDVFFAILDEANKHDLKVVTHLPETVFLEDAVAAGLDSSEHFNGFENIIARLLGEPVSLTFNGIGSNSNYFSRLDEIATEQLQQVYQRLYASGITFCPTVVTFKTLTNIKAIQNGIYSKSEYVSQDVLGIWQSQWTQQDDLPDFIWQNWLRIVVELNKNKVPLMVGTDLLLPGIIPGFSVHEEMVIWQDAGIPPADVLRSATVIPVQFMGLGERLGSASVGKTASLVLLRSNPLDDIRNAADIDSVFLRGQYFDRPALDQLLLEAKELAQQKNSP